MSTGLLKQLNSNNANQMDSYLTHQPEISFFKYSFKKYSNFSIENIEENFPNRLQFGQENNITIKRHGDLIKNIYLKLEINAKCTTKRWGCVKNLGLNLIDYIELYIGEQKIDVLYGDWLNIWFELSLKKELVNGLNEMIGNNTNNTTLKKDIIKRKIDLFIPLQFFFNKNYGLSLPLISLQRMEVKLNIKFKDFEKCINSDQGFTIDDWETKPIITGTLLIDYIYLDTQERNIFARSNNEILIEQHNLIESITLNSNSSKYNKYLNIYNVTKSLYWNITLNKYIDSNDIGINIFLGENLKVSTIRFILMCICSTEASNTSINDKIKAGSIFKIKNDYTIEIYDKGGNVYDVGTKTKLNYNYKYYNDIKSVLENCIVTKDIEKNTTNISDVDISFLSIRNYLDNNTYSLQIKDLILTSDTSENIVFSILNRSEVSGGISLASYDVRLYNYNNHSLYTHLF